MNSLCSVVIVTYNSAEHIEACIDAVLAHSRGAEIVVVDNNSSDATLSCIGKFGEDVTIIRRSSNDGFAVGLNEGVRNASRDFAVALNPDTIVSPDWLIELCKPLQSDATIGATTPMIVQMSSGRVNAAGNDIHLSGITTCRLLDRSSDDLDVRRAVHVAAMSGACFAVRRSVWQTVGGLDETFFLYLEDTEFSLRLRAQGYRIIYVPAAVVMHDYRERFEPWKVRYLQRNRWLMLASTFELRTLIGLAPVLALVELAGLAYAGTRGVASLRAYFSGSLEAMVSFAGRRELHRYQLGRRRRSGRELLAMASWKLPAMQLLPPALRPLLGIALTPLFGVCRLIALVAASNTRTFAATFDRD